MSGSTTKVLIVGPQEVGKTVLSNFLADPMSDPVHGEYRQTKGARIVELSTCHLWDVSGNKDYADCWPAIGRNADGVILVFNPDNEGQEHELVEWYQRFVKGENLNNQQCIIFANQSSHMKGRPREPDLPEVLMPVQLVTTNTQESPRVLSEAFEAFMKKVRSAKRADRDRVEDGILGA